MARGGKRAGSGRKIGSATKRTREVAVKAAAEGITPLEYMLNVIRDSSADIRRRDSLAAAAAPYMHPRLSTIEHGGKDGGPIQINVVTGFADDRS